MKDLKEKYEKQTIEQIESQIKKDYEKSAKARMDATLALYYLKSSGRYKENPLYSKSSFKVYLEEVHMRRENTFNDEVHAYMNYPKEAVKWSPGVVAKVRRECGAKKEKEVFKEVNKKEKSLKTPIQRHQIQKIITAHAKPKPKRKWNDYKAMYNAEVKAHQITKKSMMLL